MSKILNKKIYRIILCILVLLSMYVLPTIFLIIFNKTGIKNELISYIISLLIYIVILTLVFLPELKAEFKVFKNNTKNSFDNGFKYWLLGLFIMIISNVILNYIVFKGKIAANEELNRQAILSNPVWYTVLSVGFIAPIMEELIFRKSLDKIFNNPIFYYLVSGLLFGFAHALADLSNVLYLLYIIPYGALGFVFALMDKKTNTVFTSIVMHSIHNLLTLGLLFIVL